MKKAFTLAEVLIVLTIIGVIAAITISTVLANSKQREYKTGLNKAVGVLNSAIVTSIALDGETPLDNSNLYEYFMRHMSVVKSTTDLRSNWLTSDGYQNAAFYTADGMRYEFRADETDLGGQGAGKYILYESGIYACSKSQIANSKNEETQIAEGACGGCGSMGLASNPNATKLPPCVILVDINGDKKPSPSNRDCHDVACSMQNVHKTPASSKKLGDVFAILITESKAIPYGEFTQKAFYEDKK